ncbi:ATP-binding cassette domain-containing protein [Candidatus Micrarchaeota archaeon]|nr:ATP-binding cassette domain-containing protein [Candidatus Micrarchaeota archaeon]
MPVSAIEVSGLSKHFGSLKAVDSVSFSVAEGEIFGLLGPNGAGKTTTISMLATMLFPSNGKAKVAGHSLEDHDAVRNSIGIVFQDPSLDDELTGMENLMFHARIYHIPRKERGPRAMEVLKLVGLEDRASSLVKTYSGGMKRRLEIARGLMHKPKILFLDEPTLGLDPQTRRAVWDQVRTLNKKHGVTIILTTHYMEEADQLCDRIAIMDHGRIIALDTPDKLKASLGGDVITILTPDAGKLEKCLQVKAPATIKQVDGGLVVTSKRGDKAAPKILSIAHNRGIRVDSINVKKPSLEDVFIQHTGRSIREREASTTEVMRAVYNTGWGK